MTAEKRADDWNQALHFSGKGKPFGMGADFAQSYSSRGDFRAGGERESSDSGPFSHLLHGTRRRTGSNGITQPALMFAASPFARLRSCFRRAACWWPGIVWAEFSALTAPAALTS